MKAYQVIAKNIKNADISVAELSRRTGINPELLRRSIAGERSLKADELVLLCEELRIDLADFSTASE